MRQRWLIALAVGSLSVGGQVRAAVSNPPSAGVLDGLSVPAVSAAWPAGEGRSAAVPMAADPIAVPTPTGAQSGLVLIAGLIGWRAARRVLRQA